MNIGTMMLGAISGLLSLYIYGFLLTWCGRLLGGRGSGEKVRAALGWANVPILWAMALVAVLVVACGWMSINLGLPAVVLLVVGAMWATVAQIKTVAEVHDFSTWRSFLTHVLAGVVLAAIVFGLVLVFVVLTAPYPLPYDLMSA